jgi:hypothetical protein
MIAPQSKNRQKQAHLPVSFFYRRMPRARLLFTYLEFVCAKSWRASLNDSARSVILHVSSMVISLCSFAISAIPLIFFTFQCLIEFHCKFSQLIRIHFFTDLLSKMTPITKLWGHGKTPFYVSLSLSYSGFTCESEQNCTTFHLGRA